MSATSVKEICEEKLTKIINNLGYELVEVEYAKKNDGNNLTFVIDSDNGILIEDCEKVHRVLDVELDKLNPTNDQPYILNVSSPGINRPIKNHRDFIRNKGKEVELKLYAPLNKKKIYTGLLNDMTEDYFELVIDGTNQKFDKALVAIVTPVIKF